MPSNSLAVTPPGSRAAAASESPLVDEQDPLAFVAFVVGKPRHTNGRASWWMVRCPVEEEAVVSTL